MLGASVRTRNKYTCFIISVVFNTPTDLKKPNELNRINLNICLNENSRPNFARESLDLKSPFSVLH